jgi:hypothetical protein
VPASKPPLPDDTTGSYDGLGVFADWKPPTDREIQFVRQDLNFTDLILGIWPRDRKDRTGWEPPRIWTPERVCDRAAAVAAAGLTPTIMIWLGRYPEQIRAGVNWLAELGAETRAQVLLDLEGDWHRGKGIAPDKAAALVARLMKAAGVRWGVTGLAGLHSSLAPIARRADFVVPQAYSIWKPGGAHWSHSRSTFPGTQQAASVRSWSAVKKPIVMGLSCYWGARPKAAGVPALTQPQTMRIAAAETVALGIREAWFWSLKWITGKSQSCKLARAFFGAKP